MEIQRAMTRKVVYLQPEDTLNMANVIMKEGDFRHMPVVEDGKVVGMISDRDVLRYGIDQDGEFVVPKIAVRQVMARPVASCFPESSISSVVSMMIGLKIDAVAVVDTQGALTGLVTSTDLLDLLRDGDPDFASSLLPFDFEVFPADEIYMQ
ncbi:MAG: CBS domain-containing protein [Myxococcales bacterium]|nr:CBS domain-containing protein [Myxococcales bacterium]MCB9644425.1 CBS domain-containing protein [Myxococcales bacterium]